MENSDFIFTDFEKISHLYGVNHLDNEFLVIDNLEDGALREGVNSVFEKFPVKLHCNAVFFCVCGEMTIRINLKEFHLSENDTLTIMSNSIMEILRFSEDLRIAVIAFSKEYFLLSEHMDDLMNIGKMLYSNPMLHLSEEYMAECIDVYRKMKKKLSHATSSFLKFSLKAYSAVLCSLSLEHLLSQPAQTTASTDRGIILYDRFIELVQKEFRNHRTIRFYACEIGISPKYFATIIKRVSGKSAREWIDEYVMLEAKALLRSRRYTIQQVSDSLSFPNQSFFAKYFKAHAGCSPTQYQSL